MPFTLNWCHFENIFSFPCEVNCEAGDRRMDGFWWRFFFCCWLGYISEIGNYDLCVERARFFGFIEWNRSWKSCDSYTRFNGRFSIRFCEQDSVENFLTKSNKIKWKIFGIKSWIFLSKLQWRLHWIQCVSEERVKEDFGTESCDF